MNNTNTSANQNTVTLLSDLEMLGFLKTNGTACRFVSLFTKTPVVDIKAGNPWGAGKKTKSGLYKVSKKNGLINANYNTSVRNKIASLLGVELNKVEYTNGDVWYKHLMTNDDPPKALPVVVHAKDDSKYYLQFFPHHANSSYVDENDNTVDNETVEQWLYKKSERPIYKPSVISIELKNIKQLKASGVIMEMPDMDQLEKLLP